MGFFFFWVFEYAQSLGKRTAETESSNITVIEKSNANIILFIKIGLKKVFFCGHVLVTYVILM